MKHSTFRKSTLISSVALLLVAIVALSGATFAWFSAKANATATGIQATTKQGTYLVISDIGTGNWSQDLDLSGSSLENLNPVTTDDLSVFYKAKAKGYDTIKAEGGYSEAVANTDYIVDRIYVRYDNTAEGATLPLKADLTVTAANEASVTNDFYRVAIKPVSTDDDDNIAATATMTTIFYSQDTQNLVDGATYAKYTPTQTKTDLGLGTINAGTVYAYDVYVWYEGEDADCKDSNSTNDITLDISFH